MVLHNKLFGHTWQKLDVPFLSGGLLCVFAKATPLISLIYIPLGMACVLNGSGCERLEVEPLHPAWLQHYWALLSFYT